MSLLNAPKRVLVVDDHEEIRDLVCELLRERGHEVDEAENGRVACRLAAERTPDLMITDLFMPDQDGFETIGIMRQRIPGLKVIALSGCAEGTFLRVARHLGAHEAMLKPFSCDALTGAVERLLRDDEERRR